MTGSPFLHENPGKLRAAVSTDESDSQALDPERQTRKNTKTSNTSEGHGHGQVS